ncbi:helix-turn-helix domain-containing protein [Lentzea tibetensis]|uniref:helix-turn-helix domain-containing protein n=1 Tax=Lentzea tibetensis TaxID=2591470 RepID=UPI00164855FE|nr:helix-turn-helix transcriptional regulator [Lentzea tibetensis]
MSQLRRLRAELKTLREDLGQTQKDVADALEWSSSKVIRIENGPVGISITDLKALLFHYKVTDDQRVDDLLELARGSKQPAWWHRFKDVYSAKFLTFLGLESSAIRIRQFQQMLVPGLLQSPEYMRALLKSYGNSPEVIERGAAVRSERQRVVMVENNVETYFIVDESVLHRLIGDEWVMRGQLLHLKELAGKPNVSIQVVPFTAGVHRGLASSFEIFQLSEQEDDYAMVVELPYQDRLIEESNEETKDYVAIFAELEKVALSPEDSLVLIDRLLGKLPG